MTAQDIMTAAPLACGPQTNLAELAHQMWQGDCGIIPIVQDGKVVGVVTDRDICMAAATRDQAPSHIRATSLLRGPVVCCRLDGDIRSALELMKRHRVRRLPVVDGEGTLKGMLSMNDILLELKPGFAVTPAQVIDTLKSISTHHHAPAVAASVAPVLKRPRTARPAPRPAPS
jgi:CBS domain-containing protein